MRLLPNIRFGTERYPEKVARRLRALNIATWVASATHAFYAVVLFLDFTRFWWLATRKHGRDAAPTQAFRCSIAWALWQAPVGVVVLLYADLYFFTYLHRHRHWHSVLLFCSAWRSPCCTSAPSTSLSPTASGAVAAALIIALLLTVPHDTGLLPEWLAVVSLVTNAIVSCGVLLLIVFYALREAARAETAAEREYRAVGAAAHQHPAFAHRRSTEERMQRCHRRQVRRGVDSVRGHGGVHGTGERNRSGRSRTVPEPRVLGLRPAGGAARA